MDASSFHRLSRAAHLAGKAINIAKTTAPHANSYPLTSFYDIPHGHAVALTLSAMLEYNSNVSEKDTLDHRGHGYVRQTIKKIVGLLRSKKTLQVGKNNRRLDRSYWVGGKIE